MESQPITLITVTYKLPLMQSKPVTLTLADKILPTNSCLKISPPTLFSDSEKKTDL
jgi:hypothetical protein